MSAAVVVVTSEDTKEEKETESKEETEAEEEVQPEESEEPEEPEAPVDVRKVQNTATEAQHKENGLAICMYHYVYDAANPPEEEINVNWMEVNVLREELQYLVDEEYFFPTWEEVRAYLDGDLYLPEKSVVLCFDDGSRGTLKFLTELAEEYEIPITSFLITKNEGEDKVTKYANDFLSFQSHSNNMHRGGGNIGHGGIFPVMPYDEAKEDLQKSIDICGHGEAFAYPFGDYNDSCRQIVEDMGCQIAVTTENRRAFPGDDPLLLPRVRMIGTQSLQTFASVIA